MKARIVLSVVAILGVIAFLIFGPAGPRLGRDARTTQIVPTAASPSDAPAAAAPPTAKPSAIPSSPALSIDRKAVADGEVYADREAIASQESYSSARLFARRGMVLKVVPGDSAVYVNDIPVGRVYQFDTTAEAYEFPAPGSYIVRIVAPDGAERKLIVTAADDAGKDVAVIHMKLRTR